MSELTASTLLHPSVLDDPYDFYATLRTQAPVWAVPGTDVVTVATFDLITEAVGRPGRLLIQHLVVALPR